MPPNVPDTPHLTLAEPLRATALWATGLVPEMVGPAAKTGHPGATALLLIGTALRQALKHSARLGQAETEALRFLCTALRQSLRHTEGETPEVEAAIQLGAPFHEITRQQRDRLDELIGVIGTDLAVLRRSAPKTPLPPGLREIDSRRGEA